MIDAPWPGWIDGRMLTETFESWELGAPYCLGSESTSERRAFSMEAASFGFASSGMPWMGSSGATTAGAAGRVLRRDRPVEGA